jgi:alpha-ketoglutarate-dependent taurine dioxygenase
MNYHHIAVAPCTVAIGADVSGVDLAQADDACFAEIRRALGAHQVLFFRDQQLEPEAHRAFAARFGAMEIHEVFKPLAGHPEISVLVGLHAEHDFLGAYGSYFAAQEGGEERIARARRVLYVKPTFTTRLLDLSRSESAALLDLLFRHLLRPEFQVRHKWHKDDVALWDRRATQHYATGDYYPEYRRMHRITVGGDRPVGVGSLPAPLRAAG